MSISLAGPSQAQTDCIHHWDIVGSHDVIPKSITPENPADSMEAVPQEFAGTAIRKGCFPVAWPSLKRRISR
jgi:hypothetical protein